MASHLLSAPLSNPDFTLPPDRRLPGKGTRLLRVSLALSLSIALPLTSLIYTFADFLAARVLLAPECAPLLPALALSIPFCAIHACCCGYYYGLKNGSPGIFTGGRAVHPHFLRPADRPCLPHEQDSYHGATGCLGAVDRGSGIGGVLSAGLWMLEACCHTAKCKHTYYSPAPPLLSMALPSWRIASHSAFSRVSKPSLYRTSFSSPGSRGLNRSVFTEFSQAWHSPLSSFHPPLPTPSPSSCSRQSRRRRRRISRTKSNAPSPWHSATACTWEFSASGSSPASIQHWAKPFTTTPMPDVSSRFYPGSARFSTSPLPWEVF